MPLLAMGSLSAHPLGNFTINHLARIEPGTQRLRVHYVLDIAEIPTFQIMHAVRWTPRAMRDWEKTEALVVSDGLSLRAHGVDLPLHLERTMASLRSGAGGLPTLYWTGDYTTRLVTQTTIAVRDSVYADRRIGWKDIVLPGMIDPTNELRSYPSAVIGSPRSNDSASFEVLPGGRVAREQLSGEATPSWGATSIVRSSALSELFARNNATPIWILLTILAAFGLGALHGLEPGHGKALLAFTLVGARATFKQAVILAGALTFAHTVAVLLLGMLLFFVADFATETLFTWITLASGLAVVAIGTRSLSIAVQRSAAGREHVQAHRHGNYHEHHHDEQGSGGHSHAIPGDAPLHFPSAVIAAMSGGIAPCPAAIVVLLTALHLHRVGYGLLLIVIFSLGLAAILSGLGFAVVRGAAWLQRQSGFARLTNVAPYLTAIVISVVGAGLLGQGLAAQGVHIVTPAFIALVLTAAAFIAFVSALLSMRSTHRSLAIKEII